MWCKKEIVIKFVLIYFIVFIHKYICTTVHYDYSVQFYKTFSIFLRYSSNSICVYLEFFISLEIKYTYSDVKIKEIKNNQYNIYRITILYQTHNIFYCAKGIKNSQKLAMDLLWFLPKHYITDRHTIFIYILRNTILLAHVVCRYLL